ncbi:hypothetical protein AB8807_03215 [Xanthomonas campestris pv. olitorii]|uniref:hypothetical protein n=1 Tax=Xanthomonas TaxID=338 RepID=UPI0012A9328B|nr:hypothetical protein [Xanthomonas citri]WVK04664.1 hypothetical protein KWH09_03200 [Xanthomonas campestris pv. olitorii]MCC4628023.1 hypothetical protein [Xanthomonas citri]QGL16768.1 hypothetical protein GH913_08130 [Xanthomonas citri pv. malvacearum]WAW86540.1 hypothetical protein LPY96_20305 [Xanthomonas citri pv. malvacearum]WAW90679.1 hypothetical protein LPY95_18865 [Xanthomonas citri pv. malvacearum]
MIKLLHQQTKATCDQPPSWPSINCLEREEAAYSTNHAVAAGLENVRPPQWLELQSASIDLERPTDLLPKPSTASAQRNAKAPSLQPIARHGTPIAAPQQDGPASGP